MSKQRYFVLLEISDCLEVYVSEPLEVQPLYSVPYFENTFQKLVFDKDPRIEGNEDAKVVEGITQQEVDNRTSAAVEAIRKHYSQLLSETDWYEIRLLTRGVAVPEDVAAQRAALIQQANDEIAAVNASAQMRTQPKKGK